MHFRNVFGCVVWLATSIYVCYLSLRIGFGTFGTPGAGFFPFWAAVMMGVFTLIHLIHVYQEKESTETEDSSRARAWRKTLLVIVSLLLYPLLLPILGYLITTFVLIGFLFLILGQAKRFWLKGIGALAVTLISYLVFYVLLDVRLPMGVFGF